MQIVGQRDVANEPGPSPAALLLADLTDPDSEASRVQMAELGLRLLGGAGAVPSALLEPTELAERQLDPRAAFLLSLIDGSSSYEEIFAACGMQRVEAITLLLRLLEARAIGPAA